MGWVPTIIARANAPAIGRLGAHEIDALRLVLRGSSVVDWFRLHFERYAEVDAFLRVNEFEPDDPVDRERLDDLHERALRYLSDHLRYKNIPEPVLRADDVRTLFLLASERYKRKVRMFACMTLKVMHIINYQEGHELLSRLPVSGAEVSILLRAKVERVVRGLLERRYPVVAFAGNTKTNDSILSKLLAKKDTQAARVLDKLRFRLVTERVEDIPPLMCTLIEELMPFNYLIPGQSDNSLFDLDRLLARAGNAAALRAASAEGEGALWMNEPPETKLGAHRKNEFSGPSYRVVSFVSEVPVRIDRVLPLEGSALERLGRNVFGTVEFQMVDRASAERNESGENRHALYKQRQRLRVKERLERGKRQKRGEPAEADSFSS